MINAFNYESEDAPWGGGDVYYPKNNNVPNWVHCCEYWTMTPYLNSDSRLWTIHVNNGGYLGPSDVTNPNNTIRPVIVLSKLVLSSE